MNGTMHKHRRFAGRLGFAVGAQDPLLAGFFSFRDAAHLIGAAQPLLRGWANGYAKAKAGPVIERDFGGTSALSFLDLIELRFIAFFRKQGVTMPTLRRAAAEARLEWSVTHPFALASAKFVTDRKEIFARVSKETSDDITYNIATGQHEMWATIEQTIDQGVVFDPNSFIAKRYHPKASRFPEVVIDPRIAFGKPTIDGTVVPTATLFKQWKAEGNTQRVAEWFHVRESAVKQAIEYELTDF